MRISFSLTTSISLISPQGDFGDLVHAAAEETELAAAGHRRGAEGVQVNTAYILVGVEFVVVRT